MSQTKETCLKGQVEPTDFCVLNCVFAVSRDGLGVDLQEVRDLLVLIHGMTQQDAEGAISGAKERGMISFRNVSLP